MGTGDPNGIPSLLYGVDVATCQELEGCQGDDIETGSLTTSWVQGSGIDVGIALVKRQRLSTIENPSAVFYPGEDSVV